MLGCVDAEAAGDTSGIGSSIENRCGFGSCRCCGFTVSTEGAVVEGAEGVDEFGRGSSDIDGEGNVHSSCERGSVPVDVSPIVRVTTADSPGFVVISTKPPCSITLCIAECVGRGPLEAGAKSVTVTVLPVLELDGCLTARLRLSNDSGTERLLLTRADIALVPTPRAAVG